MLHLTVDMEGTLRNELREACSPVVNKMLFELYCPGELNSMSESRLMDYIKKCDCQRSIQRSPLANVLSDNPEKGRVVQQIRCQA